jgi:hypothetical protein
MDYAAAAVLLEEQILAAIVDGTWRVRSAQFADQSVQLNTLDDAQKWLLWLKEQAAAAATVPTAVNPHVRWAVVDKGFD